MEKRLKMAEEGRKFWNSQEELGNITAETAVLWLCEQDLELNKFALKHLGKLLQERRWTGALLLCAGAENVALVDEVDFTGISLRKQVISQEIGENLLVFYEMYQFTDRLFLISLEKPYGSTLTHLERQGFGKEKLLKDCIYQLKEE